MSRLPQLFMIPAAITFGCGTWQMQRKKWKEDLIERRQKMLALPPIPVATSTDLIGALEGNADWEYRVVQLHGHWEHDHEMIVGMRSQPRSASARKNAHNETGYHLITPFTLEDGKAVLVNRGWIPMSKRLQQDRPETLPTADATVKAVAKRDESSTGSSLSSSDNLWMSVHTPAMMAHAQLKPAAPLNVYFEQLADTSQASDLPISRNLESYGRFSVNPEGHAMYAATWYSLTIAALAMGYFARRPAALSVAARQAAQATKPWNK